MALPSSGPITLQMIADEFGGTPPLKLKDYYGVAPGIPTSGPIKLKDFYGTSAGGSLPNVVRGSFVTAVPDIRDHLDSQAGGDAHLDFASIAQDGDLVVMAVTADGPAGVFCQLNNAADHQVWGDLSMEMEPPTLQPLYYVAVTQWESQKKNPYFINVDGNGAGVSVVGVVFAAEELFFPVVELRMLTSWNMSGPMVVRNSIATSPLDSNDLGTINPLELVVQVLHRDDEDFISSVSAPDYTLVDISNSTDPGRTAQSSTAVLYKHISPPVNQEVPVTDIAFDGAGDFSAVTTTIAFQGPEYDMHWDSVALRMDFEDGIVDVSSRPKSFSAAPSVITQSGDNPRFGSESLRSGHGEKNMNQYITATSDEFDLMGPPDSVWTFEGWVYIEEDVVGDPWGIFMNGFITWNMNRTQFAVNPGNKLSLYKQEETGTGQSFTATTSLQLQTWHNFAVVQNGENIMVFMDGIKEAEGTYTESISPVDQLHLCAVRNGGAAKGFQNGYIDDLRLTIGVARYDSNYPKPTKPYPIGGSGIGS